VPEEGEEYLLNHLFGIVQGDAERKRIPEEWMAKFVKEF
jgi:hypothetical protein